MELSKIEFTVTILIYLTALAISEDFEISRARPSGEDGWIFGTDLFKIPPSLCIQGGMSCAHFGAQTKSTCYCSCPYREATFLFHRSDWRCFNNVQTRQLLGYNQAHYFQFETERLNYPIRVVYLKDYKRVSLSSSLKNCRVDVSSSRHIGCNGSEVPFNNTNPFSIIPDGDPRDSPPYFLKVEDGATNTKLLEGRIIKLGVVCNGFVNPRWLLFKYLGNIKCLAPTLPPKVKTKPGERNLKLFPSKGTGVAGNTAPTRPGSEQGTDDSSSYQGLIAGLTASILAVLIIVGFFVYRRGYLNKLKRPKLPAKKRVKRKNTTSGNTQSSSEAESGYRAPDIKQASTHYASTYVVPSPAKPSLEYTSSSVPVGLSTHCYDDPSESARTQEPVYKAVYKDPDCDSEMRPKKKSPTCVDQPVYNQVEELSAGEAKGPVQDHDNGIKQPGAYLSVPVGHQASGHDNTLKSAAYRDPDFDSELRSKLKGPVRAEQAVYNQMEELSVRGTKGPTKGHDNGTQQPVCTAVYRDPDFDSELRSKLKGPVRAEQPVYNQMEELSVRGTKAPTKGRANGTRQPVCTAVYKDPDLDSELRSKLKDPVRAEQPVYNQMEELSVRGTKGPTKGRANGTKQPVCTAVYKDPDLDKELKPKKKGPVCVQQPVYNHMEELAVRGAQGRSKGRDNGTQQPIYTGVYKDPDLDSKLRSKKKGPVCVQQLVYNHVEELSVQGGKGPSKGRDNGTQQPVCTAVYKDPDFDTELRPKKKSRKAIGPAKGLENDTQPEYNVLESYLECSKRASQYGTMTSSAELVFNTIEKSKPDDTKRPNGS